MLNFVDSIPQPVENKGIEFLRAFSYIRGMEYTEKQIIYMQDKMFPQWRRYWNRSNGKFIKKPNEKAAKE